MRRPAVESFSVVDPAGRIWWARPDQNGPLPSGERGWEWGVVTFDGGVEVLGDWLTRVDAIDGLMWEAGEIERQAREALDAMDDERYEGGRW